MFEQFEAHFLNDGQPSIGLRDTSNLGLDSDLLSLLNRYAGQTFGDNVYRIFSMDQALRLGEIISTCFEGYGEDVFCFGADWMGRVFATNAGELVDSKPSIIMFHPEYGEIYSIPYNILDFHNKALVELAEEVVAVTFYHDWLNSGGERPSATQCVSHEVPLLFGGADDISNLKLVDLEAYWVISAEIIIQTRGLPEGAEISSIQLR
tara:strand:- start:903 stop:1523 length:621 start_codon:yes stop_codon:yes gene_type:complete